VSTKVSAVVAYDAQNHQRAAQVASQLAPHFDRVVCAGPFPIRAASRNVTNVHVQGGRGAALRGALEHSDATFTMVHAADVVADGPTVDKLLAPLREDVSDAVFARRNDVPWVDQVLGRLSAAVSEAPVRDPHLGLFAFRTDAVRKLKLTSDGDDVDVELLVKLAAQAYRVSEVPVKVAAPRQALSAQFQRAKTLLRYATTHNDADNLHEGYNTLARMEGAPNYNAWLGRRFREHLGSRVLEIGAGIGTITREIEEGRELVIALEMDRFYVDRLKNRFRGKAHVRPYLSDVSQASWDALARERLDSIVLSNVLEHIEDDAQAVRNFRRVLQPGGKLLLLVPALPQLYGAMDEAVGHFRRYTSGGLRTVLEGNGFAVDSLEWMNLVGIPGWFVNGRLFRRRAVPPLQLRLYDTVAPALAQLESRVRLPVGMSLFAVARAC
jgi:SAM-dependent methyltransferase